MRGGDRRKSTASFYTPQSITDYVVRRTLHPLVARSTAERILELRILDPAMGSAAFLVAACRYLAGAYERALVRENVCHEADIDELDRAGFRRLIAQRCLFGVDLNPTAVQLARLSLWLATLAADKPLTFLDHRLLCGDSLIGASAADLARQPPLNGPKRRDTPLFHDFDLEPSLAHAVRQRKWLAETSDDSPEIVREKESRLDRLAADRRWKALCDLWCACWMWPDRGSAPDAALYSSLADGLAGRPSTLRPHVAAPLLDRARDIARERRFFHWTLEFPEVFFDVHGRPLPNPGFDAVLGNPPWDMLRADSGSAREKARPVHSLTKQFLRGSGIYHDLGRGHINRYQVFLERAAGLAKRGGRLGLVLPSGFATDHTSSAAPPTPHGSLRDRYARGFDNRKRIFPIHRSVRFVIFTATTGSPTRRIRCRFGIDDPAMLETIPDSGDRAGAAAYRSP